MPSKELYKAYKTQGWPQSNNQKEKKNCDPQLNKGKEMNSANIMNELATGFFPS